MKIALILDPGTRKMVFTEKCLKRLEKSGEVVINENGTDFDSVAKVVEGADVIVTACPLCKYNLSKNGELPIVYFTELLAEALGVK